jgi:CRISPR-associated protein Csb2
VPDGDEIPYTWIGATCLSTSELLRQGWSEPPALQRRKYSLPDGLMDGTPPPRLVVRPRREPKIARYQLTSKVLPLLTEALPIAERARAKLMGIHKRLQGGDPEKVSPLLSGKQPDGSPLKGHRHAFVMPRDEDGDGRIDHLVVYCPEGFGKGEVEALDSFGSMWQSGGKPDIRATLLSLSDEPQTPKAARFVSHTPFVTKRHYRKGRGPFLEWLRGEIERECGYHGLPGPTDVQWRRSTPGPGHRFRWLEFTRSRKGEMPLHGYGCRLTFPKPLRGPVALGSYCHFGLGQFIPAAED